MTNVLYSGKKGYYCPNKTLCNDVHQSMKHAERIYKGTARKGPARMRY